MSRPHPTETLAAARAELLGRLGLGPEADDQAVEHAHDRIADFLGGAPEDLRGWADRRHREADRVLALLTGPESELVGAAGPAAAAQTASARRPPSKPVLWAIGLLAGIGLVAAVYSIGPRPSDPAGAAPGLGARATAAAPDPAAVAELKARVERDPGDTASLQALATLYLAAGDDASAATWAGRVLDLDPTNEKGLLSAGVAAFNSGDLAGAETLLARAVELYPGNAEAHYDLGFLYMSTQRTDLMRASWERVVQIAPDSELAQTVRSHSGATPTPATTPQTGR